MDTTPLRRRRRMPTLLVVAASTTVLCAAGLFVAATRAADAVPRVAGVADVLSDPSGAVDNYLLVGSDSRALGDPNTGGTEGDVSGTRSDTIMVLRIDKASGDAALLSIPRDLYVQTSGHTGRINGAYNDGAAALVSAVQEALQVPVHHYVEIDFYGFKTLVDALGGVQICFAVPTRDVTTGLSVPAPGCVLLDGTTALAYARSRHYEELKDGEWIEDPSSDLGRSTRQRDFVNRSLQTAVERVKSDPFSTGELVRVMGAAVAIDDELDPIDAAASLRTAVDGGLATYSLPVVPRTIDGAAVLSLGDGADAVLAFFRGTGPAPSPSS
ncbi:MAG: LCP family protein [Actinomycetota bacterium]|nr:LCP family protein [Actinomycetota bacterium]